MCRILARNIRLGNKFDESEAVHSARFPSHSEVPVFPVALGRWFVIGLLVAQRKT